MVPTIFLRQVLTAVIPMGRGMWKGYSLPRVVDDECPRSVLLFFKKNLLHFQGGDSPSWLLLASRNVQPFDIVIEVVI